MSMSKKVVSVIAPIALETIKDTAPKIINNIAGQKKIAAREAAKAVAATVPATVIEKKATKKGLGKKAGIVSAFVAFSAIVSGVAWTLVRVSDKKNVYEKYMESEEDNEPKCVGSSCEKPRELDAAILDAAAKCHL